MKIFRDAYGLMAGVFGLTLLITACNTKISQCNDLIEVANAATTQITSIANQGSEGLDARIEELQRLSDELGRYAIEIRDVSLEDDTLQNLQQRLGQVYSESSMASRGIVEGSQAGNIPAMRTSLNQLSEASRRESQIVSEINGYCQAS